MNIQDLTRISDTEWEIPKSFRHDMRVPVRIFATQRLLEQVMNDRSLEQAVNSATLPGLVGAVVVMPDMHQGYGFPIGGVAATDWRNGVVSPGGVGFDINCGVRLVTSTLTREEVRPKLKELVNQVFRDVPCGTGGKGRLKLGNEELERILSSGARWLVKRGYAEERDAECAEEGGCMREADPDAVSARAKERGRPQVGTLGSGNHFLEIQFVQRIHDPEAARAMNLEEGQEAARQVGIRVAGPELDRPPAELDGVPPEAAVGQRLGQHPPVAPAGGVRLDQLAVLSDGPVELARLALQPRLEQPAARVVRAQFLGVGQPSADLVAPLESGGHIGHQQAREITSRTGLQRGLQRGEGFLLAPLINLHLGQADSRGREAGI